MKRKWMLFVASTTATLLIALGLIRWLAPALLGIAPDMQLVQVSREVPPFYDNVFRDEDAAASEFILQDPVVVKRALPLFPDRIGMGPNDILGFRNRSVPNVADIITIGDSQTYGNNAPLELNWPSQLTETLSDKAPIVYNISCGGWDGVQYLEIFDKALRFSPRVVVVAFYTGNDPLGGFAAAYGGDRWQDLRPDPSLKKTDAPKVSWPPKPEETWSVRFTDRSFTVFTPNLRLSSNLSENPAVKAGYGVLANVGRGIAELALEADVPVVFIIIPTKELVFWPRLERERHSVPDEYRQLVRGESDYIEILSKDLASLPGANYVDVVRPLQEAAQEGMIYPTDSNGHPLPEGYRVIGETLAGTIDSFLPEPLNGLVIESVGAGGMAIYYVRNGGKWLFASVALAKANGWSIMDGRHVTSREIGPLEHRGIITTVEPDRFGPAAVGR